MGRYRLGTFENIHSVHFMYGYSECLHCKRKYVSGHICKSPVKPGTGNNRQRIIMDLEEDLQGVPTALTYNERLEDGFKMYKNYFVFRDLYPVTPIPGKRKRCKNV